MGAASMLGAAWVRRRRRLSRRTRTASGRSGRLALAAPSDRVPAVRRSMPRNRLAAPRRARATSRCWLAIMTTAYQFDRAGLLVGETVADESPLEPGVWLIPAGCTLVAPPAEPAGQRARWNGVDWELVTMPAPAPANDDDPVEKLRAFLADNPDVAAILEPGGV